MTLAVKVRPRARHPGILDAAASVGGESLRIGVAEPAEDGRANAAVCKLIASALGVPAAAVTLIRGTATRDKVLRIDGDPARLGPCLDGLAHGAGQKSVQRPLRSQSP